MNTKKQPSKFEYIVAWFLFAIVNKFQSLLFAEILTIGMINTDDIILTLFLLWIVSTFLLIVIFIFIYNNMFSTLNIKRVMPYLYFFGGLGTLIALGEMRHFTTSYNVSKILLFFPILSFAIWVLVVRTYYINKPDRWY